MVVGEGGESLEIMAQAEEDGLACASLERGWGGEVAGGYLLVIWLICWATERGGHPNPS